MVEGFKKSSNMFQYIFTKNQFFFQSRCKKIIQCIPINSFTQRQRVRTLSLIESFNSWTNTPNTWPRTQTLILYCKLRILYITSNIYYFCESGINYFVSVFILSVDSIHQENSSRNRFFILLQEITTKVKSLQCFLFFL